LSEDRLDDYKALKAEYDGMFEKVKAYQSQIESAKAVETATVNGTVEKSSARLPFETVDDPQPETSAKSEAVDLKKAVYVTKYGEADVATKAILTDLYGANYEEKRDQQMKAFVRYIRTGHVNAQDESLLKTLIYLPEHIKEDIASQTDYSTIKASTLQEAVNELGGFLVPEDYRNEIIKRLMADTVVRRMARVVTTNRDAAEWPKLEGGNNQYTSGVRVTWVDELPASATVSQTNPEFGMLRVPVHTVMARTDISRNQLEDSAFNMLSIIADLFSEASVIDEDTQFLTGTGGGRPFGILGNRSGAEETPATGITVANSGAAAALTSDGLFDLVYSLPAQYRGKAVIIGARTTHRDLRKLKDGESRYLWQDSLQAGQPATLLGYPVYENESMPTVGANKHALIYGNLMGYLIVDRVGMTIERVQDTTTVGGNKVALFMRRRLGGQVIEPWRFAVQKVAA
jgi:HK97 family phage major capsid protein